MWTAFRSKPGDDTVRKKPSGKGDGGKGGYGGPRALVVDYIPEHIQIMIDRDYNYSNVISCLDPRIRPTLCALITTLTLASLLLIICYYLQKWNNDVTIQMSRAHSVELDFSNFEVHKEIRTYWNTVYMLLAIGLSMGVLAICLGAIVLRKMLTLRSSTADDDDSEFLNHPASTLRDYCTDELLQRMKNAHHPFFSMSAITKPSNDKCPEMHDYVTKMERLVSTSSERYPEVDTPFLDRHGIQQMCTEQIYSPVDWTAPKATAEIVAETTPRVVQGSFHSFV